VPYKGGAQALADALVALLEDEPRRRALGTAARELARERYSWDDIGRRLTHIYELLSGTPATPVRTS
jgi:glycosyltransferase involved in cell wall biosynthesis